MQLDLTIYRKTEIGLSTYLCYGTDPADTRPDTSTICRLAVWYPFRALTTNTCQWYHWLTKARPYEIAQIHIRSLRSLYYSNWPCTAYNFMKISIHLITRTRHNPHDYLTYLLVDTSRNTRFSVMLDGTSQTVPLLKQLPRFFLLAIIAVVCSSAGLKTQRD